MSYQPNRQQAWELLLQYNESDALIKHALAVEAVMRHFAAELGEDEEKWGVIGLLHDLDYERYPDQHCDKTEEILKELDVDETWIRAILSHGYGLRNEVKPELAMEQVLYATDELTGLINAVAIMRPSKSVLDLELSSVRKKFKQLSFAAGVNRDVIRNGAEMLGTTVDDLIVKCIDAMRLQAEVLGLKGNL